jgi:hypothetical protein
MCEERRTNHLSVAAEIYRYSHLTVLMAQMFAVGEFWKDSLNKLGTQFSVFDAPLHYSFKEAGEAGNNFDLRQIFDGTLVKDRPMDAVSVDSAIVTALH